MQPTYIPWSGYFALMMEVDYFVFLDDVQLIQRSWHRRNRIKANNGERMLSIPVDVKNSKSDQIQDVLINNSTDWNKKHLNFIKSDYHKSVHFDFFFQLMKEALEKPAEYLGAFNKNLILRIADFLNVSCKFMTSSSISAQGTKVTKTIGILKELGASKYLSPVGSFGYIDENNVFADHGVELMYQNFTHPVYAQQHGDFISHLSIMDMLFNQGIEAKELIAKGISKSYQHEELKSLLNEKQNQDQ